MHMANQSDCILCLFLGAINGTDNGQVLFIHKFFAARIHIKKEEEEEEEEAKIAYT